MCDIKGKRCVQIQNVYNDQYNTLPGAGGLRAGARAGARADLPAI